jgi:hypothetical protein
MGVEVVGGFRQARRGQAAGQIDDAVLDALIIANQHHQRPAWLQRYEFHVLDPAYLLIGKDDAGAVRQTRDHLARVHEHLLDRLFPLDPDLGLDAPALLIGQVANLEQPVDEQPQPDLGRQASGRGVRRKNVAQMLQIGHDVANRGGRQRHGQVTRQIARTDRLSGGEVSLHDLPKNGAGALVELLQLGKASR